MSDLDDAIETADIESVTFSPELDPKSDTWEPARRRLKPSFGADLVLADGEFSERDSLRFLSELAEGYGPDMIGLSLGWTPAKTKRFVGDPDRVEIIEAIREALNESVEHAILQHARDGNSTAMKLWAYNRMQHRGWADRREVRTQITSQAELVVSVRAGLQQAMGEMVAADGEDAIRRLQATFLPELEAGDDIVDGEIVE